MHKILLVEDNEINRDMLSRRLMRKGYEVAIATNGSEAIDKAQSEQPDLVLMDLHLPVLDGWQATQQIKANPHTQSIPVIALTADAMAGERDKALAAGCDDYNTKPVDLPQLIAKMTRLLTQAAPLSFPPQQSQSPEQIHLQQLLRTRLRRQEFDPPLYSLIGYSDLLLNSLTQSQSAEVLKTQPNTLPNTQPNTQSNTQPNTLCSDVQKILTSGKQLQQLVRAVLNPSLVEIQQQAVDLLTPMLRREMLTPLSTIIGYCELLIEDSPANVTPDLDRIYISAQNLLSKVNGLDSIVEKHIESIQSLSDDQRCEQLSNTHSSGSSSLFGQQPSPANERLSSPGLKDSQVLVIDTDVYNCALLSRHLECQGLQATVAATGELALEAIASTPYDLIILDVTLLQTDNRQLLDQLKGHKNTQHTPVLVIAAPDEQTAVMQSIAMGASDYLMRPYQSLMLRAKVAQHIEHKRLKSQQVVLTQKIAALQTELACTSQGQHAAKSVQADNFQPSKTELPLQEKQASLLHASLPSKVLLIEDNKPNADMLSRRLVRAGYEVVIARDGAEGVAKASAEQPQVILMDISLPVIDGWEATQLLKASAQTDQIPVIALTAHAMAGDREKAIAAGCDDYDTKPVDLPRLLGKIENCLERLGTA